MVAVSGCGVLGVDGRCGPESREVLMRIAPTPLVGHGQLTVVEREAAPPRTLSWLLESEQLRLQYVLPQEDASALAERIYLFGGLRWCTRHELRESDGSSLG